MAENAVNTEQGVILEALNNKVDLNQLNTNNQGLSYVSGLGMPSDRYIDLTLGASGTEYTAPANGYFYLQRAKATANTYIGLFNVTKGYTIDSYTPSGWTSPCLMIVAEKNDIVRFSGAGQRDANETIFRFYYAVGSESEE